MIQVQVVQLELLSRLSKCFPRNAWEQQWEKKGENEGEKMAGGVLQSGGDGLG